MSLSDSHKTLSRGVGIISGAAVELLCGTAPLIPSQMILSFILSIKVRHTIYNKSFIAIIYHSFSMLVFYT